MTLKKNNVSPIFKKLKIHSDWTNSNVELDTLSCQMKNPELTNSEEERVEARDFKFSRDKSELMLENSSKVENLTGYSRIQELKLVKIGIASSEQIVSWAEKVLPNGKIFGEVLNANTLHYKTFKPQKGGLFCQRIFGPLKDFECACGIVRKPSSEETLVQNLIKDKKSKRVYCSVCDVEYTWSVVRRYQLGYIKLASPVTHLWYLKANPSYLSMLLDVRKKDLEDIIYCTQTLTLEDYWRPLRTAPMSLNPTLFFESYKKYLTLASPLNQNTSALDSYNRLKKKQVIEKQRRQTVNPRRRSISYLNTQVLNRHKKNDESPFSALAFRSKKDQIESLEIAYKLSTDDNEARKFSRLTNVARILIEKRISANQRECFFNARNFSISEFYEQIFERFSKKSFLTNYKLSLKEDHVLKTSFLLELLKDSSRQSTVLNYTTLGSALRARSASREREERAKRSDVSNFTTSGLKDVLKNHFKFRDRRGSLPPKRSATGKSTVGLRSQKRKARFKDIYQVILPNWGPGNYYRYLKLKPNSLIDDSPNAESSKKNRFLTIFLIFLRKSKIERNWESIYNNSAEALLSFSTPNRKLNVSSIEFSSNIVFNLFDRIFSNAAVLYLLFILQSETNSLTVSQFLKLQKKCYLRSILNQYNVPFFCEKTVGSLKDLLTTDFFSKKVVVKRFVETENVLKNTQLNEFISLSFQSILKIYLLQQLLQKQFFYKKKTFKIFFVKQKQNEDFIQIQSKFRLKNSIFSEEKTPYSRYVKQKIQTNYNILAKQKKILGFVKNRSDYPSDALSYLKNILQIRNKVVEAKQQKQHFSPSFQIFNNIYTASYLEAWQTEKDWKYFLYYNKAFVDDSDFLVSAYTYRFPLTFSQSRVASLASRSKERLLNEQTFNNSELSINTIETEMNFRANSVDSADPFEKSSARPNPNNLLNKSDNTMGSEKNLPMSGSEYLSVNPVPIIGANILQKLLFQYEGLELKKMAKQHQNVIPKFNRYIRYRKQTAIKKSDSVEVNKLLQVRDDLIRRLKLLRKLFKKNTKTSSMVLNTIPVLPPDLRPILKMQNQIAASDLNRFYQRILYRNDRLKKFIRANSAMMNSEPAFEVKYAQRLLQEAVDNLIQNGKGQVKPETNSRGQPLKSLSEILKGKQGRFRQYLLGKRVDYSGRSVIVVGPTLKIYECGLPFEMAMELFLPFLIKRIFQYGLARTVIGAKTILKNDHKTTWHLLEEIMQQHPILLNRAPTLHRLGIQAFRPKLITGRAILLHPLVCPAFNADFDGDQMAVHVPITVEARTEAWKLMFSRNHLISPATGEPVLLPTQDMVLGCYYLTTTSSQDQKYNASYPFNSVTRFYFSNMKQILQAYLQEKIHLQTPIWMRWNGLLQSDSHLSTPQEIRVMPDGSWLEIQPEYQRRWSTVGQWNQLFVRTTPGRILFNLMIQNCIESKA